VFAEEEVVKCFWKFGFFTAIVNNYRIWIGLKLVLFYWLSSFQRCDKLFVVGCFICQVIIFSRLRWICYAVASTALWLHGNHISSTVWIITMHKHIMRTYLTSLFSWKAKRQLIIISWPLCNELIAMLLMFLLACIQ